MLFVEDIEFYLVYVFVSITNKTNNKTHEQWTDKL